MPLRSIATGARAVKEGNGESTHGLFQRTKAVWYAVLNQSVTEMEDQKVLSVIEALGPVIVVIDEADAALGSRGTSSRMFAMIASLMIDTEYGGRIPWMLLTCRPDRLPVDLKRQGRCEVHIPRFAPATDEARREMFASTETARRSRIESRRSRHAWAPTRADALLERSLKAL